MCEAEYGSFDEVGEYQVVEYALDDGGNGATPRWVLAGEKKVYLPLVLKQAGLLQDIKYEQEVAHAKDVVGRHKLAGSGSGSVGLKYPEAGCISG